MSSIIKFFKHQFVNPSIMTQRVYDQVRMTSRTKNIWCAVGCGVTTVLTLSYLFNETEKHNAYYSNTKS